MHLPILKYPRTPHLAGSRHQLGDGPEDVALSELAGRHLVIEEKIDGANSGLSFAPDGKLLLQSRGHYLTGGPRERHFALFKTWAGVHQATFREVLGSRYVVYGEWAYAKHTAFYDALPHYFLEFDVWDREESVFLSTAARRELLYGLPIVPVPVLAAGPAPARIEDVRRLIGPSLYRTPGWRIALDAAVAETGSRAEMVARQTEVTELAEGLYLKVEDTARGVVTGRLKFVRGSFLQTILDNDDHWHDRPIIANRLAPGVGIFSQVTGVTGAYDDPDAF